MVTGLFLKLQSKFFSTKQNQWHSEACKYKLNLLPAGPKNFTINSFNPPKIVTSCLLSILEFHQELRRKCNSKTGIKGQHSTVLTEQRKTICPRKMGIRNLKSNLANVNPTRIQFYDIRIHPPLSRRRRRHFLDSRSKFPTTNPTQLL